MISVFDKVTGGRNVPAIQLLPCIIKGNLKSCCFFFIWLYGSNKFYLVAHWGVLGYQWRTLVLYWLLALLESKSGTESKVQGQKRYCGFILFIHLSWLPSLSDHFEPLELSGVMAPSEKLACKHEELSSSYRSTLKQSNQNLGVAVCT